MLMMQVVGCARAPEPLVFHSPTAKPGQFERDRYECLQQSQQPHVVGTANAYRASHTGQVVTNIELMISCMAARGYQQTSGPAQPGSGVVVRTN